LKDLNTMKNFYLKIVYIFIFIGHLYFKYFNKNWARILDLQFISPYFLNFYQIKLCYFFMNNYYILKGLIVIWEIFFIYQNYINVIYFLLNYIFLIFFARILWIIIYFCKLIFFSYITYISILIGIHGSILLFIRLDTYNFDIIGAHLYLLLYHLICT